MILYKGVFDTFVSGCEGTQNSTIRLLTEAPLSSVRRFEAARDAYA
jgi:hypothetical protein